MSSSPLFSSSTGHARAETLATIAGRPRPERRLLGMLALAAQYDDYPLMEAAIGAALDWAEGSAEQRARKAHLLYEMTALLARARHTEVALRIAPLIPYTPGMAQVLEFSVDRPPQRFCWRVTPAYALVHGRSASHLPIEPLIQPYRHGRVSIDHSYLRQVLLPRRRLPRPILLLPHPLGLVQLAGRAYIILDGNHRVVCAWQQNWGWVPGFFLTPKEADAVQVSHSRWPPYAREEHLSGKA